MIKTVKLQNTMKRTFNGIKPGNTINVDVANAEFYKNNGFVEVVQVIKQKEVQAQIEAQDKKNQEIEQANAEVQEAEQAQEQTELDKEFEKQDKASDLDELNAELAQAQAPKKKEDQAKKNDNKNKKNK